MKNSSLSKILSFSAILFAASCLSPLHRFMISAHADDDERAFSEAKNNIALVNKVQINSLMATEKAAYLKTFDELDIGTLRGGRNAEGNYFSYKIQIRSKKLAAIGAKSKNGKQNGLNGAVFRSKTKQGLPMMQSIICKSNTVGADGTAIKNLPVVDRVDGLVCATGWKNI